MANRPLPTPEILRQLLRYEPETDKLFWLPPLRHMFATQRGYAISVARRCGKEAFTTINHGYKTAAISGTTLYAHRVIWALNHGEWPDRDIDHINGEKTDNRLCNLRLATRAENLLNTGPRVTSRSGRKGVHWTEKGGKWVAQIRSGGKTRTLGRFTEIEDAAAAYNKAAIELFGEFARIS